MNEQTPTGIVHGEIVSAPEEFSSTAEDARSSSSGFDLVLSSSSRADFPVESLNASHSAQRMRARERYMRAAMQLNEALRHRRGDQVSFVFPELDGLAEGEDSLRLKPKGTNP